MVSSGCYDGAPAAFMLVENTSVKLHERRSPVSRKSKEAEDNRIDKLTQEVRSDRERLRSQIDADLRSPQATTDSAVPLRRVFGLLQA